MVVIPDIHGRTFWKNAVQGHENEIIVFLGDYMDPYYQYEDGISYKSAIQNLREIIAFKKEHMKNVVLLVGNHDFHYLYDVPGCWRFDEKNCEEISNCFISNENLFQMAYEQKIGNETFLFTHAGVRVGWLEKNKDIIKAPLDKGFADHLNQHKDNDIWNNERALRAFMNTHEMRGGLPGEQGSPIWADVREHLEDLDKPDYFPSVYQVFGHTMNKGPIVTERFAMLDCKRAFEINEKDGSISDLKTKMNENTVKHLLSEDNNFTEKRYKGFTIKPILNTHVVGWEIYNNNGEHIKDVAKLMVAKEYINQEVNSPNPQSNTYSYADKKRYEKKQKGKEMRTYRTRMVSNLEENIIRNIVSNVLNESHYLGDSHNKDMLIDLIDNGEIDATQMAKDLITFLDEDILEEFINANRIGENDDEDDEDYGLNESKNDNEDKDPNNEDDDIDFGGHESKKKSEFDDDDDDTPKNPSFLYVDD